MYFEYICWKFTGRLLDRVNTLLDTNEDVAQMFQFKRVRCNVVATRTNFLVRNVVRRDQAFRGLQTSSEEIVVCSHALVGHYCCKFTHVR